MIPRGEERQARRARAKEVVLGEKMATVTLSSSFEWV